MDGFWFYWSIWLFVIWNVFFSEKAKQKKEWMYIGPVLLISTSILIPIFTFQVRLAWLVGMIVTFSLIARLKASKKIHLYVISLFISGSYLLLHYFIYFEPVWLITSPLIIMIFSTAIISILLLRNPDHRIIAASGGFIQADFLLWFLLWNNNHPYSAHYILGDFVFLDMLTMSLFIIFVWNSLENIAMSIKNKWFPDYQQNQPGQKNVNF